MSAATYVKLRKLTAVVNEETNDIVQHAIDQLGGIVLPGGSDDLDAGADDHLLLPLGEVFCQHGRTADQVDR